MKSIIFLILLSSFTTFTMGQNKPLQEDFDYKNFAKYYEKAQTYMQQGDVDNGRKYIKNAMMYVKKLTKKGLEGGIAQEVAQLEQWQAGIDQQKHQARTMAAVESELGNWYSALSLLKNASPRADCAYLWTSLKEFDHGKTSQQLTAFRSSDSYASASSFIRQRADEFHHILNEFDQFLEEVKFKEKADQKINSLQGEKAAFYDDEIKDLGFYVQSFQKVSPQNATVQAYMETYTRMVNNKSQILANAKKAQQAASVISELPVADVQDAYMERDFMRVAGDASAGYVPVRAIITSRYWAVNNDITGKPVSRQRIAAITYKHQTGKCYLEHILFIQHHRQGTYGRTEIYSAYGKKQLACNLVSGN
ncbi:MAG: hypothetical protein AAF587_07515 [Bacteroidota bacterium]